MKIKWSLFTFEVFLELLFGPIIIFYTISIGEYLLGVEYVSGYSLRLQEVYQATLMFYFLFGFVFIKLYFGVLSNNSRKKHVKSMTKVTMVCLIVFPFTSPVVRFLMDIYDSYFGNAPMMSADDYIFVIGIFCGATFTFLVTSLVSENIENRLTASNS